jgi:DNA-binding MarR family transcriptional regulator
MTRGAVSKVIDKLETKKWLQSEIKDGDNRVRLLSLTRDGRRIVPVLAKFADNNDAHFFGCLDANEKLKLRQFLAKIAECHNLNDVPTD